MRIPTSASPAPRACKICGAAAFVLGVVDFNKSCEELRGLKLPLSGHPIYYRQCSSCEFAFTDYFDDWSHDEFLSNIYNTGYKQIDPDFESVRPLGNANFFISLFGSKSESISVLDFGGGNGKFSAALQSAGFLVADTYDPFMPPYDSRPISRYNIVTSFETLEHSPDPCATVTEMLAFLEDGGLVIISTLLQPSDFEKLGTDWWYAAPRNGHVSLQSQKSLTHLWASKGLTVLSLNANVHFAFQRFPEFAHGILVVK